MFISSALHYVGPFRDSDKIYTPLPLYHTAGGVMAIGQALLHGNTIVIKKKFSASAYFKDCVKYKCTVSIIIYINFNQRDNLIYEIILTIFIQ